MAKVQDRRNNTSGLTQEYVGGPACQSASSLDTPMLADGSMANLTQGPRLRDAGLPVSTPEPNGNQFKHTRGSQGAPEISRV